MLPLGELVLCDDRMLPLWEASGDERVWAYWCRTNPVRWFRMQSDLCSNPVEVGLQIFGYFDHSVRMLREVIIDLRLDMLYANILKSVTIKVIID